LIIVNTWTLVKTGPKKTVNYTMRFAKYLLVPWTAIVVYTCAAVFNGSSGLVPYRELLREREKLLANLEKLQQTNHELEGTMDALLYDSETIRVKARELGYGRGEERFVRIVGLPSARNRPLRAGFVMSAGQPFFTPDRTIQLAALCAALILFAVFVMLDTLSLKKGERGTPYDSLPLNSRETSR
jgi:cell division protein FtsB